MSNVNTEGLPPEMQARIAEIIEKAKQNVPNNNPNPPAGSVVPPVQSNIQRPPTLMDHTVALRQEVASLRQELHAVAQVTDAVGQAVGQLYQTFLGQSELTNQGSQDQTQMYQEYVDDTNDY